MNYLFTLFLTFTLVPSLTFRGGNSSIVNSEGIGGGTIPTIPVAPDKFGEWVSLRL